MYCDSVHITSGNVFNLAYLSDKYLVHRLKDQCILYFSKVVLTCENAAYFASSRRCLIPELQDTAMLMLQLMPSEASHSRIEHDVLRQLLQKDFINLTEYDLFHLCLDCVEHELKTMNGAVEVQRKDIANEMKDLVQLMHFPLMKLEDFTVVSKYGFLTDEETRRVFQYICERDHYTDDNKFWESKELDKVTAPVKIPMFNHG